MFIQIQTKEQPLSNKMFLWAVPSVLNGREKEIIVVNVVNTRKGLQEPFIFF